MKTSQLSGDALNRVVHWCEEGKISIAVSVGPYSVLLNRTDEGLVVDVYPINREDAEPLASTWVHDNDLIEEN